MNVKRCARCGGIFPISKFNKNSSMSDGLQMHCRRCEHIAKAEWRAKQRRRIELRNMANDVLDHKIEVSVIELASKIVEVL